jgi:hypothetical protein
VNAGSDHTIRQPSIRDEIILVVEPVTFGVAIMLNGDVERYRFPGEDVLPMSYKNLPRVRSQTSSR